MPITVTGLRQITKGFKDFEFAGPRIQKRFLTLIGQSTVLLLQQMGPRDTGELNQSWRIVAQGKNYVEVGTDLIGLVSDLELGTSAHVIRADLKLVVKRYSQLRCFILEPDQTHSLMMWQGLSTVRS